MEKHIDIQRDRSPLPFVKWVGGKRRIIDAILTRMPGQYANYFEPFVGGGAVALRLSRARVHHDIFISDLNEDLILTYKMIRDRPDDLIEALHAHARKHSAQHYYSLRATDRSDRALSASDLDKASRFIYLNKAGFNGLYRVNKKGHFNVPFGKRKNAPSVDENNIHSCSSALKQFNISCADFRCSLAHIKKNDFVYIDPPYIATNGSSNFTSYTKEGFDAQEQLRLRDYCDEIHSRGAYFLLSNSCTPYTEELYKERGAYQIERVLAPRSISCKGSGRGSVREVFVSNFIPETEA